MKKRNITLLIIFVIFVVTFFAAPRLILTFRENQLVKAEENKVLSELSDYRSGTSRTIHLDIDYSVSSKPEFVEFLTNQAEYMIDNGEYELLVDYLGQLENEFVKDPQILSLISESLEHMDDLDIALQFNNLKYYNSSFKLSSNSALIVSYFKSNGSEKASTTPGTGYYADKEDVYYRNTIGITSSPLYDAVSKTYIGDFAVIVNSGVELNSYYKETHYSRTTYYFRNEEIYIDYFPSDGEFVYSGDYLFCFSPDGALDFYVKIDKLELDDYNSQPEIPEPADPDWYIIYNPAFESYVTDELGSYSHGRTALFMSEYRSDACKFEIIQDGDAVAFRTSGHEYLCCDGSNVYLLLSNYGIPDEALFILGYSGSCNTIQSKYGVYDNGTTKKVQYLDVYDGGLACYGWQSDSVWQYEFELIETN